MITVVFQLNVENTDIWENRQSKRTKLDLSATL